MQDSPNFSLIEQPSFNHSRLSNVDQNFRLIKLLSWSKEGGIKCHIQEANISSPPTYTAVSYEWGSLDDLAWIEVNDTRFQITRNLHNFLTMLCCDQTAKAELIFVDAICIDQTNIKERNAQVKNIDRVYSRSTKTRIWLGQEDDGSAELFHLIDTADATARNAWAQIPKPIRGLGMSKDRVARLHERHGDHDPQYLTIRQQLHALLLRTYWSRAWIIQEIVLSETILIHCGQSLVHWDHFLAFYDYFMTNVSLADENPPHADTYHCYYIVQTRARFHPITTRGDASSILDGVGGKPNMFELLQIHNRACCTDTRDRIYSLLGITVERDELPVDYSQSILAVFLSVMAIFARPKIDLLVYCLYVNRVLPLEWDTTKAQIEKEMLQHSIPRFETPALFVSAGTITRPAASQNGNPTDLFSCDLDSSGLKLPNFGYYAPKDKICYSSIEPSCGDKVLQSVHSNCALLLRPSQNNDDKQKWTYLGVAVLANCDTIERARVILDEEPDLCDIMKVVSTDKLLDFSKSTSIDELLKDYKDRDLYIQIPLSAADIVRVGILRDEFLPPRKLDRSSSNLATRKNEWVKYLLIVLGTWMLNTLIDFVRAKLYR